MVVDFYLLLAPCFEKQIMIHQALLSQFSLLAEFVAGKLLVSRILKLMNLNPGKQQQTVANFD
jgi:hypothetical protein